MEVFGLDWSLVTHLLSSHMVMVHPRWFSEMWRNVILLKENALPLLFSFRRELRVRIVFWGKVLRTTLELQGALSVIILLLPENNLYSTVISHPVWLACIWPYRSLVWQHFCDHATEYIKCFEINSEMSQTRSESMSFRSVSLII